MIVLVAVGIVVSVLVRIVGNPASTSSGDQTRSPPVLQTLSFHGVTVRYPLGFLHDPGARTFQFVDEEALASALWTEALFFDDVNTIVLQARALPFAITADNLDRFLAVVDIGQGAAGQTGGPVTKISMGGLPGFEHTQPGIAPTTHEAIQTRAIVAFQGTTAFSVNCQFKQKESDIVAAACDQVVGSFRVATPAPGSIPSGWTEGLGASGLELALPPEWKVDAHPLTDFSATFPGSGGRTTVYVQRSQLAAGGTLDDFVKLQLRVRYPRPPPARDRDRVTFAGEEAVRIDAPSGSGSRSIDYFVSHDGNAYVVTFFASKELLRLMRPTFDEISGTFSFSI